MATISTGIIDCIRTALMTIVCCRPIYTSVLNTATPVAESSSNIGRFFWPASNRVSDGAGLEKDQQRCAAPTPERQPDGGHVQTHGPTHDKVDRPEKDHQNQQQVRKVRKFWCAVYWHCSNQISRYEARIYGQPPDIICNLRCFF